MGNKNIQEILNRLRSLDFSGNTGQAMKNSSYEFSTKLVSKGGSLIFTIIIARLLMPELFGLYNLTLATIVLFAGLSDLGLNVALVRFISREPGNGKGYFRFIFRLKTVLSIVIALLLGLSAYYIANVFYGKPIFYALLAGMLYIFFNSLTGSLTSVYHAQNNFKRNLLREVLLQTFKLILVPLVIIYTISLDISTFLFYLFIGLSLCLGLALISLTFKFPRLEGGRLSSEKKKNVLLFAIPLTATTFSTLFFGSVDSLMLGRFVSSTFIGYYAAALSLIASSAALITFSGSFLPIFSRMNSKNLKGALKKSALVTLFFSVTGTLLILFLAQPLIYIVYGKDYGSAIQILRILSPLFITSPLIGIFQGYFISKGRTSTVFISALISLTLNIILNLFFITLLMGNGSYSSTIGVAVATVISRGIYLSILVVLTKVKE